MPDLEDPLQSYTGLSLFSRTFTSLPPPHNADDPHPIHDFLKSLPIRDPDKLIEQAKNILSDSKNANDALLEDENNVVNGKEKEKEYPRGRRPGLGSKRPRFSLLPNVSLSAVNLEPSLDFDKLNDPEEFFMAYERMKNAKKEIAKQTGRVFTDNDDYNVFKVPQSQRPGIPGRSRAKYKHLYPTMQSQETTEGEISNCGSQQETSNLDASLEQTEPSNVSSQQMELTNDDASQQTESANAVSEEMEQTDSIANAEKRVNKILDEFLAHDYDELDGDGAVNLLKERLQIKPLRIHKLNLPELPDTQRIDFMTSGVGLSKPTNELSDINNLLKVTRNRTPIKLKNIETSVPNFVSPTPPKSPLASLSLLKKRILQSNRSTDLFSAVDIDQSSSRNISPFESINKHSDPVDTEKTLPIFGQLNSLTTDGDDSTVVSGNSAQVAIGDFTSSFEQRMKEHFISLDSGIETGPRESVPEFEDNNIGMDYEVIKENLSWADAEVDLHKNGPNELEDIVEDVLQEGMASAQPDKKSDNCPVETSNNIQNKLADGSSGIQDGSSEQIEETAPEQNNEKIWEPTVVPMNKRRKAKLHSCKRALSRRQSLADPAMVEDQPVNECPEVQDSAPHQTQAPAPEQPSEEQTIAKSHPRKEYNSTTSHRQSLAGCGLSWEGGVRRSTRIRSRPLQYWKGERFLYGRIHQSLATIIGIKYESPGSRGPELKVKSFIAHEYKDLVEQAALY